MTEGATVCRKPFKPPCSNGYGNSNEHLARRLWARKRFVPWGSSRPALVAITNRLDITKTDGSDILEEIVTLPPGVEPLVLWQPEQSEDGPNNLVPIAVDPLLVRFLRPHQRYCSSVRTEKLRILQLSCGICRVEFYVLLLYILYVRLCLRAGVM